MIDVKDVVEQSSLIVTTAVGMATEAAEMGAMEEANGLMLSALVAQNDAIIHLLAKIAGVDTSGL